MPQAREKNHDVSMQDLIDEADQIATDLMLMGRSDPDRPVSTKVLAHRITGARPEPARILDHGQNFPFKGQHRIWWNDRAAPERQCWIVGHELAHVWFRMRGTSHEHEELLADIIGAMLVAPRVAFARAHRTTGSRVKALARHFKTTEALVLLRIGEVTGRPVLLLRQPTRIARGEPFVWPEDVRTIPRKVAHLVRVDGRWGMMAA